VITRLEGFEKTSRYGKAVAGLLRACVFALAFAALSQVSFAFPRGGRAYSGARSGFSSGPRGQRMHAGADAYAGLRRPAAYGNGRPPRQAPPPESRPRASAAGRNAQARPPYQAGQRANPGPPHLGAWLQRHSNMSPADQTKALQNEPGFNQLPQQTQRQLVNRLRQIDNMPPAQRQLTVDRIEALEHLTPQMRDQVRASSDAMRTLPADRQRMVKKAFRDLSKDPPEQRTNIMASPQFQGQFTPQERGILSNLLSVEPYEPNAGFRPEYAPPPGK
jgi:hypothetical protein